MVLGLAEPANAIFLSGLQTKVTTLLTSSSSGITAESIGLIFDFFRVVFILFVVAAAIFAFVQSQQGNDPRPIIGVIVMALGTIMGVDVLTFLIAGGSAA